MTRAARSEIIKPPKEADAWIETEQKRLSGTGSAAGTI